MNLTYLKIKNFLSIGDEPVEIDFSTLGPIVQIIGRNKDKGDSNAAGKSSSLMAIPYGFYGKTLKDLSQKEVINDITEKGLEVDIRWENNKSDKYRVFRTRKPDGLRFWKNEEELTLGGIPATQEEIEKEIGLSYQAFINITYFGQHNELDFLKCDPATKRQIVENILALDQYNNYCKNAKEKKKKIDLDILVLNKQYSILLSSLDNYKKQHELLINQSDYWIKQKNNEISQLEEKLIELEKASGSLLEAQNKVDTLNYELNKLQEYKNKIVILANSLKNENDQLFEETTQCLLNVSDVKSKKTIIDFKINKINEELNRISKLEAGSCPVCYSVVNPENSAKIIDHLNSHLIPLNTELLNINEKLKELNENLLIKEEKVKISKKTYNEVLDRKSWIEKQLIQYLEDIRKAEGKLEQIKGGEIGITNRLVEEKRNELNAGHPFYDAICQSESQMIETAKKITEHKENVKSLESKIPYLDYWIKAFGDQGIRKLVIQDTLPTLNAKINHWLMFLADGKMRLNFDLEFQETIKYGPPSNKTCRYKGLSGGELCRVNLAISQGFAQVTSLNSNICPMFICLDEVAANVDRYGVSCLYNTILELAKERRVFVVTHDPDLQAYLASHDSLIFERKDDVTRLVKS